MKRRYARKKTSRVVRRKRYMKKRFYRKGRADKGYLEKVTVTGNLQVDASTNFA